MSYFYRKEQKESTIIFGNIHKREGIIEGKSSYHREGNRSLSDWRQIRNYKTNTLVNEDITNDDEKNERLVT